MLQGGGRHDNPALYGCLYVSVEPVSAVVEQLAGLTGTSLEPADLLRHGNPLALAAVELDDGVELLESLPTGPFHCALPSEPGDARAGGR